MKNLKLEVGKTYLNRKGERVKIVKDTGDNMLPFIGDNYHSYTPNGGYWPSGRESHLDLIAEAPIDDTEKRTFKIPENTREISVSETDGRIIIEFVPEVPKFREGDVVYEDGRVMIVKSYPDSCHAIFYARLSGLYIDAQYGIDFTAPTFRLATPAEAQQLFDALAKDGKRWNPDTLEIEELTELKRGDVCINEHDSVYIFKEVFGSGDHKHYAWLGKDGRLTYNSGAIPGRLATPAEAQQLFDALAKDGKRWNAETLEIEELTERERIRAFLHQRGWGGVSEDSISDIEAYIKEREAQQCK